MDRFIVNLARDVITYRYKFKIQYGQIYSGNCSYPNKVKKFNLKSNMDRFIDISSSSR